MSKRRIMRAFKILEVSGVERPAQAHARAAIIKRADDDADGTAGFEVDNSGARARLRLLIENQRRSRPHLSESEAVAAGWRALNYADRQALLGEGDDGEDIAKRAVILDGRIATSTIRALAELRRKADPRLTIEKCRADVRSTHIELARREREARLALA